MRTIMAFENWNKFVNEIKRLQNQKNQDKDNREDAKKKQVRK